MRPKPRCCARAAPAAGERSDRAAPRCRKGAAEDDVRISYIDHRDEQVCQHAPPPSSLVGPYRRPPFPTFQCPCFTLSSLPRVSRCSSRARAAEARGAQTRATSRCACRLHGVPV